LSASDRQYTTMSPSRSAIAKLRHPLGGVVENESSGLAQHGFA
jgi:hypothetical protein